MLIQRLILIALYTLFFFAWGRVLRWLGNKWAPFESYNASVYMFSVFAIAFLFVDFPYYDFTRNEWIGITGGVIALLFEVLANDKRISIPFEYGWPVLCGPMAFLAHGDPANFSMVGVILFVFAAIVMLLILSKVKSLQWQLWIALVAAVMAFSFSSSIFLSIVLMGALFNILVLDKTHSFQARNNEMPMLNFLTVYLIIGIIYRLTL